MLGVSPDSSDEELKSAARSVLKKSHPDAGGDTEVFIKASKAYKALSSPAKRLEYEREQPIKVGISVASGKDKTFILPKETGEPAWYKEPQDILSELDIALIKQWQSLLLRIAHEFGAALEIKAGISKSLAGYDIADDIAIIGTGESVPQRWAAECFILKRMVELL